MKRMIRTELIKNKEYRIEKINKTWWIKSSYSPYKDFSNAEIIEYTLRMTDKKGVIVKDYFNDLSNKIEWVNKVYVNKDKLSDIFGKLELLNKETNKDVLDSNVIDLYHEIDVLYNGA